MQEVGVSVPPQAVELGLLVLMAAMPEQDHCFPWHPCLVLEPSKENFLGTASGRCWGCSLTLPVLGLTFITCWSWFCTGFPV